LSHVDGQKIMFTCKVAEARKVPKGAATGTCDPYIEVRVVDSDPSKKKGANIKKTPSASGKTRRETGQSHPKFEENVDFAASYSKKSFVQLILWDYNPGEQDEAIGYCSLLLSEALNPPDKSKLDDKGHITMKLRPIEDGQAVDVSRTTCTASFSCKAVNELIVIADYADKLPKPGSANSFKNPDTFCEVLITRGNPTSTPADGAYLTKKSSKKQAGSLSPKWEETLKLTYNEDDNLFLRVIVWDAGSEGMKDASVGQIIMPMSEATTGRAGDPPMSMELALAPVAGSAVPFQAQAAKLYLKVGWEVATVGGGKDLQLPS